MGTLAAVIGLGDSWKEFKPEDYDFTIGVNDIWRNVKTDYIVCLDYPRVFAPDRLKIINDSKPKIFFSQMVKWDTRMDFEKIDIIPHYLEQHIDLNRPGYYKSYCSPFVAVQIAWRRLGAEEIHLFGVDLLNHPHLKTNICGKIKNHFVNLKSALKVKGCELIIHGEGILKDI